VTTAHTISVSFIAIPTVTVDAPATLTSSSYKWLSPALITTQANHYLRPAFKTKIIDDTITPNQVLNSLVPPFSSGSVAAPDGNILAVGLDNSGYVNFYKGSNLHSGSWDSNLVLDTSTAKFTSSSNRYVIAVSDYIQGSYYIDIWYFTNFDSSAGANLQVQHWYSSNGGASFTGAKTTITNLTVANYPTQNLGLAAFKPIWSPKTQTVQGGFIYSAYLSTNFSKWHQFEVYYRYGDVTNGYTEVQWLSNNVDSFDWTIDKIDCFYLKGYHFLVFSGFRNFFDAANQMTSNYGIWVSRLTQFGGSSSSDVWSKPYPVQTSLSVSNANVNIFTYPRVVVTNDIAYLTYQATTVDSVASTSSGTVQGFFMSTSIDGLNFTYPTIVTINSLQFGSQSPVSFVPQGQYFYLLGGNAWEYKNNNIVADVTADTVQYEVQEAAGQASSVTLQVANQNNQWYPSGTNPGAAAILGGRKVVIQQGYYTDTNTPEYVPRNVFFIDDITQSSTSNSNDITVTGRDFYKKMVTSISRFAAVLFGPFNYFDAFSGTLSNWNQQAGTWIETTNNNDGCLTVSSVTASDTIVSLANMPPITYGSYASVSFMGFTSGEIHIYFAYLDSNNWARIKMYYSAPNTYANYEYKSSNFGGGSIQQPISVQIPTMTDTSKAYTVVIRQYEYYKFNVLFGGGVNAHGNSIGNLDPGTVSISLMGNVGGGNGGVIDLTNSAGAGNVIASWGQAGTAVTTTQWSIALGCNNSSPNFKYFHFSQLSTSLTLVDVVRFLAGRASNFVYKLEELFTDYFHGNHTYVNSSASVVNRNTVVQPLGSAMNVDYSFANGEMSFKALAQSTASTPDFYFIFRANNTSGFTSAYRFRVSTTNTGYTHITLQRYSSGTWYILNPGPFEANSGTTGGSGSVGNLNFDLTKPHTYRAGAVDNLLYLLIDDLLVGAWTDPLDALSGTNWGWATNTSCTLYVSEARSTALWKSSPSLSVNPGDDVQSTLLQAFQAVRGWVFSDLFGRFKALFLDSTNNTSTYTYQTQLITQGTDLSDKEYVSQVTVYGNGVSATARDLSLMQNANTRDLVVVDYTITTSQDAQNRATYELQNAKQYTNQYNPKQVMNVGAELFDAITVTDTGTNNTGVNSTTRVYAQKLSTGGQNNQNEYSIELDTGTLN
jgi:hypothetical protein